MISAMTGEKSKRRASQAMCTLGKPIPRGLGLKTGDGDRVKICENGSKTS